MALRGPHFNFVVIDEISAFAAPRYCKHGNDVRNTCPRCEAGESEFRGMEGDDQLVEIDNKWGYAWGGSGLLEVGDMVVLPSAATIRRRGSVPWWVGRVTDYGSSWTGQHVRILRRATSGDLEIWAEIQEAKAMARPKRERFKPKGS